MFFSNNWVDGGGPYRDEETKRGTDLEEIRNPRFHFRQVKLNKPVRQ